MNISKLTFFSLLTIGLILFVGSGPASATLSGSKHDFSSLGGSPCAYCHSVHHAVGGLGRPAYMGPLPVITKIYSSVTIKNIPDLAGVNNSDAPLCLTCHDSVNVPSLNQPGITSKIVGTKADLNSDLNQLKNDHPVGFTVDPLKNKDLKIPTRVSMQFGINRNEMWCGSCHNVHDNTTQPFLIMANNNSALCYECHNK